MLGRKNTETIPVRSLSTLFWNTNKYIDRIYEPDFDFLEHRKKRENTVRNGFRGTVRVNMYVFEVGIQH